MTNSKTERVISIDNDLKALVILMVDHGLTWEFVYNTIYDKVRDFDD